MEILIIITTLGVAIFLIMILYFVYEFLEVNPIKIMSKFLAHSLKPKSPLDKEIAETEKEISELEEQKVKMEKLKELERRKERLFKEVNEEDTNNQDYKPMPETMSVGHNSVVVGYTDNSEQTFYRGKHDFDKIKTLFQYGLPIEEQDVRS